MTALRETREVVGSLMHLLHERRLCIDQPFRPEHAMQFGNDSCRFQHMFQHSLHPDAVEHAVVERQPVAVGHQHGVRRGIGIGADQFDGIIPVEFVRARTNRPAADHEHHRPSRIPLQQIDEFRAVGDCNRVAPEGQAMQPRPHGTAADVPLQRRAVLGIVHSALKNAGCKIDQYRLRTDHGKAFFAIVTGTVGTGRL